MLPVPETVSFTLTLVVSLNQPLATAELVSAVQPLLNHISLATVCSRFWSTVIVRSTYVYLGVNKSLVYPESFVNTADLLNKLLLLWCCVTCTQTNLDKNRCISYCKIIKVDNIYSRSCVSKIRSLGRQVDRQENGLTYTEMGSPTHKLVHLHGKFEYEYFEK